MIFFLFYLKWLFFSPFFFPSLLPHSYIHLWSKVSEVMNVRSGTNLAWCSLYYLIRVKVSIQKKKKKKQQKQKKNTLLIEVFKPLQANCIAFVCCHLMLLERKEKSKKSWTMLGGCQWQDSKFWSLGCAEKGRAVP